MTNEERLIAALEYQRAMQPAFGNPNLMRQGQRMNLPARQVPGPVSEFGTQAVSFDQQPDQGYGTMAAEMALGFVPGIGQAMAVRDLERARRDDDPLGMALAGLSLVPFGKLVGALRGGKQIGPVSQLDVWHGSPYKFDQFDASKIGTGEGAQAYGHGLYLAENPNVAEQYRESLTNLYGTPTKIDGGGKSVEIPLWLANKIKQGGSVDTAISEWTQRAAEQRALMKTSQQPWIAEGNAVRFEEELKNLQAIKAAGGGKVSDAGALYKVDLPDAQIAKILDWDKPMSEGQMISLYDKMQQGRLSSFAKPFQDNFYLRMEKGNVAPDGQDLFMELSKELGGQKYVSDALRDLGIPGIRYLDGGSRAGGKGTSNFVVFPGGESMLTILERNNQDVRNMMKPTVPESSLMYKDPFGEID
jgi:hypothetical protein